MFTTKELNAILSLVSDEGRRMSECVFFEGKDVLDGIASKISEVIEGIPVPGETYALAESDAVEIRAALSDWNGQTARMRVGGTFGS